jgi:hypothetical protein
LVVLVERVPAVEGAARHYFSIRPILYYYVVASRSVTKEAENNNMSRKGEIAAIRRMFLKGETMIIIYFIIIFIFF